MLLNLDVVVDPDPTFLPFRVDIRLGWQRLECGTLNLFKQGTPTCAEVACHSIVELIDEFADGCIELD